MEKAKKKHSKFFVAAWILTGLFVLAISDILLILWNILAAFEKTDPRHYIDEVVTAIEQQRYSEAAALSHFEESRFFTEKQYEAYIKETLGEGTKLKVMEAKSETEGEKVYRIKGANGELRFILTEQPNTLGFGMSSYSVRQDFGESGTWKITAPSSVPLTVNGVPLDESFRISETSVPESYRTLHDTTLAPQLVVYEIDGLYTQPIIESKEAGTQISYSENDQTAQVSVIKESIPQEREDKILKAAKTYAYFVSGDATLTELSRLLYRETAFYDSVKTYSSYWYISHDSVAFENLNVSQYTEYGEDAFSAEVSFDYRVRRVRSNIDNTYPTHYRVSFATIDGALQVVNIEVL